MKKFKKAGKADKRIEKVEKIIVLISGKLRTGKNQFATYVAEELMKTKPNLSVKEEPFAKGVKDGTKKDLKPIWEYINSKVNSAEQIINNQIRILEQVGSYKDDLKKVNEQLNYLKVSEDNFYEDKTELSRKMLQVYGTDIFRNQVDMDHWVKTLIERVKKSDNDVVLVTDVRFPNEIELMKKEEDFKIITVRIYRYFLNKTSVSEHNSEKALDHYKYEDWDYVFDNNKRLEDLKEKAKDFCKHEYFQNTPAN